VFLLAALLHDLRHSGFADSLATKAIIRKSSKSSIFMEYDEKKCSPNESTG
jgi:hypothetical protein